MSFGNDREFPCTDGDSPCSDPCILGEFPWDKGLSCVIGTNWLT